MTVPKFLFLLAWPIGWDFWEKTGKYYKMFTKELTWMEAQLNCITLGVRKNMGYSDDSFIWLYFKGHLAIIRDEETNDFVFSLTGGLRTWLGLRRVGPLVNPKPRYREELYLLFLIYLLSRAPSGACIYGKRPYTAFSWKFGPFLDCIWLPKAVFLKK